MQLPLQPSLVGASLAVQGFQFGVNACLQAIDFSNGFQITVR